MLLSLPHFADCCLWLASNGPLLGPNGALLAALSLFHTELSLEQRGTHAWLEPKSSSSVGCCSPWKIMSSTAAIFNAILYSIGIDNASILPVLPRTFLMGLWLEKNGLFWELVLSCPRFDRRSKASLRRLKAAEEIFNNFRPFMMFMTRWVELIFMRGRLYQYKLVGIFCSHWKCVYN